MPAGWQIITETDQPRETASGSLLQTHVAIERVFASVNWWTLNYSSGEWLSSISISVLETEVMIAALTR